MTAPHKTHHPLYPYWATLRHRYAVDPRWAVFDSFVSSVTQRPGDGMILMPKSSPGMIGPDNHVWVDEEEHRRLYRNAKWYWYKGILLRLSDWAYVFDVTAAYVGQICKRCDTHGMWQDKLFDKLLARHKTEAMRAEFKHRLAERIRMNSPGPGITVRTQNAGPHQSPASWFADKPPS